MSWRFKASKYKNAAPVEAKKELHIKELSIGSYSTGHNERVGHVKYWNCVSAGNYIDASAAYIACNWDTLGSSLAVFPIGGYPSIDGKVFNILE